MSTEIEAFLCENGKLSAELAPQFAECISFLPDDLAGMELKALIKDGKHGKGVVVTSRHPRNLLINWTDLLFKVGTSGVGAGAATVAHPLLGIVACLGVVYSLVKTAEIELSKDHAAVVDVLWLKNADPARIPLATVDAALASQFSSERVTELLRELDDLKIITFDQEKGEIEKRDSLIVKQ